MRLAGLDHQRRGMRESGFGHEASEALGLSGSRIRYAEPRTQYWASRSVYRGMLGGCALAECFMAC